MQGARKSVRVPSRLPPSVGQWEGWDWNTFYLAVLTILEKPSDIRRYDKAMAAVYSLPQQMVFTLPILAAAWARFGVIYPRRDNQAAYGWMLHFAKLSGRLRNDPYTTYNDIEYGWRAIEEMLDRGNIENFDSRAGGGENPGLSDITYQVRGLYFLNVIPAEYRHPGTGTYSGTNFIPDMIPFVQAFAGAYKNDMVKANSMTEFEIAPLIDQNWDYYSNTTSAALKMYHLANLNGYHQLYMIKTGKSINPNPPSPPTVPSEAQTQQIKAEYTFKVISDKNFPVMIDGVYVGEAPVSIKVGQGMLPDMITPGQHLISVGTSGYKSDVQTVIIPPDMDSYITASPTKKESTTSYKLYVSSEPQGAAVLIDNKDTGRTTNSWLQVNDTTLKPGAHYVRLEKQGYIALNFSVNVEAQRDTYVSVKLDQLITPPSPKIIGPYVLQAASEYGVQPGPMPMTIHPKTYDSIVAKAMEYSGAQQDMIVNEMLMDNLIKGYVPGMQEIMETTDFYCVSNLEKKNIPIGQGFDTLDSSLFDEIVNKTASETSVFLLMKSGMKLKSNAMEFFKADATDSIKYFGFKRGR